MKQITNEQYFYACKVVKQYIKQLKDEITIAESVLNSNSCTLEDSGLNIRTFNAIRASHEYLGIQWDDIKWDSNLTIFNGINFYILKRCRGIGKKSLIDFKEILDKNNISYINRKASPYR